MLQRLALLLAGMAAAVTLTVGLVAAGYAPSRSAMQTGAAASDPVPTDGVASAAQATVPPEAVFAAAEAPVAGAEDSATTDPETRTEVHTVYVEPAASPKTVTVVKHAAPKAGAAKGAALPAAAPSVTRVTSGASSSGQGHHDDGTEAETD